MVLQVTPTWDMVFELFSFSGSTLYLFFPFVNRELLLLAVSRLYERIHLTKPFEI